MSRTSAPLLALQTQYGSSRVEVLAGDMADFTLGPKAVELAIKKWGRLDAIVVNHGGLEPVKRVGDASVEEWRAAFDSGVFGGVGLVSLAVFPSWCCSVEESLRTHTHTHT
jgi:NADP-dependent 3-hydroxy acid dehydrogenase YdfG